VIERLHNCFGIDAACYDAYPSSL